MKIKKNFRDQDSLTYKTKPNQPPIKLLEVTPENLNSVLLELKKDDSLLKLNLKNIINFMFKTYHDNSQILSKLKILKQEDVEGDVQGDVQLEVVDSIFWIITNLLGYHKDPSTIKKIIVTVSGELYPFSRRLSLWYFDNKQLEEEDVEYYLDEIERIIFKTANVNFITGEEEECMEEVEEEECINEEEEEEEEEDNTTHTPTTTNTTHTPTTTNTTHTPTALDLEYLTDSEEMDRLDKALGIVFKDKQLGLSVADKKRIAKCLDVIEAILQKNPVGRIIHFKRLLGLVDIDDTLFKKVFRVLKMLVKKYPPSKTESLYALYAGALFKYRNISRTIDTMQDYFKGIFKWGDVFKASSKNEQLDLNIVDRSRVSKEEFYTFCFHEKVHLWKIQGLLLYFTRKEENIKILEAFRDLVNKIEFSDERLSVIESINNRIKVLK